MVGGEIMRVTGCHNCPDSPLTNEGISGTVYDDTRCSKCRFMKGPTYMPTTAQMWLAGSGEPMQETATSHAGELLIEYFMLPFKKRLAVHRKAFRGKSPMARVINLLTPQQERILVFMIQNQWEFTCETLGKHLGVSRQRANVCLIQLAKKFPTIKKILTPKRES